MTERQHVFMDEAVRLAFESMREMGGGPFGAVIVRNRTILARGKNRVTPAMDPTAHAEIVAIREACKAVGDFSLSGCSLYTSCYPCPMCMGAVYWARLDAVYYASTTEDAAHAGFDDEIFYHEIMLPPEKQKTKIQRVHHAEAMKAFSVWKNLEGKVHY